MTWLSLRLPGVSLACALAPATAQKSAVPAPPNLAPGALVRLEARGGQLLEGRFEQYHADTLFLQGAGAAPRAVPLGSLSRLWVRGRATKTGMIIGGGLGIPLGVVAAAGLCDLERRQENNNGREVGCTEHYVVTPVGGAALGAAIGALIGHFIPKWNLRFRLAP